MKSIEQFREEQAKSLALHEKMLTRAESFAALGLPVPEYISDSKCHGAIHISYRNNLKELRTMARAVELFGRFANLKTVIPFHVLKDGSFTTLHPELRMPAKKSGTQYKRDAYKNAGYAAKLTITHMGESTHTNAKIEFFALVADDLYSISIEFGTDYIGQCSALRPNRVESRNPRTGRVESRKFNANTNAHALADAFLSYSYGGETGPVSSGSDHRHMFVSDTDENGPVECSHAIDQLENLAAIVDK